MESPHFTHLARLDFSGVSLDPEAVALLTQPHVLPGLRTLIIAFDDQKFRDQLRRRFGEGLFVGSDEEPQDEIEEEAKD